MKGKTIFQCSKPVEKNGLVYVFIAEPGPILPERGTAFELNTMLQKFCSKFGECMEGYFEFNLPLEEVERLLQQDSILYDPSFDSQMPTLFEILDEN